MKYVFYLELMYAVLISLSEIKKSAKGGPYKIKSGQE